MKIHLCEGAWLESGSYNDFTLMVERTYMSKNVKTQEDIGMVTKAETQGYFGDIASAVEKLVRLKTLDFFEDQAVTLKEYVKHYRETYKTIMAELPSKYNGGK